MTTKAQDTRPLSKEQVFKTAVTLADEAGVAALSMRKLAKALGVEAMSLYHHVKNKDEVLDGMVDLVFAEIELPRGKDWKSAMRERAESSRAALLRHPWALGLMDSRTTPGPATLTHHDAVLGALRSAGFSVVLSAHAFSLIDSYIYGFVMQEISLPFNSGEELEHVTEGIMEDNPMDAYPHLSELAMKHVLKPDDDAHVFEYAHEFDFGLALILEGLEQKFEAEKLTSQNN